MVKRSEWTEAQGVRLAGLRLGKPGDPGRVGVGERGGNARTTERAQE